MEIVLTLVLLSALATAAGANAVPTASVWNGSIAGAYLSSFRQDLFLGIPFAQPPLGSLRLSDPEPLNVSWTGLKPATQYSPACLNFGEGPWAAGGVMAEDCLTLNVVRPSGTDQRAGLPVAVWIHGGAYLQGGSRDPRYNLTYVVDQGVRMHSPFIGVSVNYRLGGLGFLWGSAVQAARVGNLGLKDQRLALRWVHENIEGFGGDPRKVTIWGESAGAASIGHQLVAFGGRDDGLFRAAILQSGSASNAPWANEYASAASWDEQYASIVAAVNCSLATDSLACLRQVPIATLADALNHSVATARRDFRPVIDGELVRHNSVAMLQSGQFVHVPVLQGQNHDEGWTFAPMGIDSEEQFLAFLVSLGFTVEQAARIADIYPNTSVRGWHDAGRGGMLERVATVLGDIDVDAMRRFMAQVWAKSAVPSYSYQFAVPVMPDKRAGHFQEVAFVFHNLRGEGYIVNPFANAPDTHRQVATLMARMWASFIVNLTPNHSGSSIQWPVYTTDNPKMLVFDANAIVLGHVLPDTYRRKGIALLQEIYQSH
jgi:carboxylesterase type B